MSSATRVVLFMNTLHSNKPPANKVHTVDVLGLSGGGEAGTTKLPIRLCASQRAGVEISELLKYNRESIFETFPRKGYKRQKKFKLLAAILSYSQKLCLTKYVG